MPNNPNSRRAGSSAPSLSASGNKIQRGAPVAEAIKVATTGLVQNTGGSTDSSSTPTTSGNVYGPASSADGNLAVYNGTTGKVIKDYGLTPDALLVANKAAIHSSVENRGFFQQSLIGYATGGNIQVRFDLGAYDAIGLTVNASFSPTGSSGMVAGRQQRLDLLNTTGSSLSLTWNASWLGSATMPTTLAAGDSLAVFLVCKGTTEATITVNCAGGAGIPSHGNQGSQIHRFANSSDARWILGAVDLYAFGALGNGSTDDSAAFTAAQAVAPSIILSPGVYVIGVNLTITADIVFLQGATIKVGNGVTVTFNGNITAPLRQVINPLVQSIFSITETFAGGVVTATKAGAHGYANNCWVRVTGADQKEYNGIFKITVTGANTFTYPISGSPASPATGSITVVCLGVMFGNVVGKVYPEWLGATGNVDHALPIMNTIAACTPNFVPLEFSGSYSVGSSIYCDNKTPPFLSKPGATMAPYGGFSGDGFVFRNVNGASGILYLPSLIFFQGKSLFLKSSSIMTIYIPEIVAGGVPSGHTISGSAVGVSFYFTYADQCLDNTIEITNLIQNCGLAAIQLTCGNDSAVAQGIRVNCNFILTCQNWVLFDGSPATTNNASENTFECDALELDSLSNASAINNQSGKTVFQNRFVCRGFFGDGGPAGATGQTAITGNSTSTPIPTNFDQSEFLLGSYSGIGGTWSDIKNPEFIYGWGNKYESEFGANLPNTISVAATTASGTRATFNSGTPIFYNRFTLAMTLPANLVNGGIAVFYFYSPYIQGAARLNYSPKDMLGCMVNFIADDSTTSANQGVIKLQNVSGSTIASGVVKIQLIIGIP